MFAKFFRSKTRSQNRSQSGLSKKRSRSRLPRFEPLEERRLLSAVPVMVADTNSCPGEVVELDGAAYFLDEGTLWSSDGTTGGTEMVKDISAGYHCAMVGVDEIGLIVSYSTANSSSSSYYQLWASDGTTAGTVPLKDGFRADQLTVFNNRVFFSAWDADHGTELWSTDGTEAGTVPFKDIQSGFGSSNPSSLQVSGENLFFTAIGDDGQLRQWVTDGVDATSQGTHLFAESPLSSSSSDDAFYARQYW